MIIKYGRRWDISDSAGGGWMAVRRHGVSGRALDRGLSNIRCAATLEQLAGYLAAETAIEDGRTISGLRRLRSRGSSAPAR
ncbi:hypothetical protein [Sphaerisporangium rufum]|uniref:hypothetical protein n=1 Tax=Sphaerisporangium rufum TaxID=1381558 RepID=UPI00194F4E5A|nr:hypothetical protein [Sphaerisporangium rufum]